MGGYPYGPEDLALPGPEAPDAYLDAPADQSDPMVLPGMPTQASAGGGMTYEQFQADHQRLEAAKAEGLAKQEDIALGQRLVKLLDPTVPKSARQFLYKELSKNMGVDPKGGTSTEVGKMLMGLDPEAMDNLRRNFVEKLASAKGGEIKQLVKGILTGEVGGMELLQIAQPGMQQNADGTAVAGSPEYRAPVEPGGVASGQTQAPRTPAPTVQRRVQGAGETEPVYQATNPQLVKILGLDDSQGRLRNDDLIKNGFRIPVDPKEQRELVTKLQEQSSTTLSTAVEAARMYQLFKNRPEVLGLVGGGARTVDQIVDQAKGLLNTFTKSFSGEAAKDEVDIEALKGDAFKAAKKISDLYKASGLEATSTDAARLQGAMINMAYSMAAARGIPGNRLTNAIVTQHLAELGNSQSVAQFEATLKDTLQRAVERNQNELASKIGKSGDIDVSVLDDAQVQTLAANSEILPDNLKKSILAHIDSKITGQPAAKQAIERTSPTLEEEEQQMAERTQRQQIREQNTETRAQQEANLKELREDRQNRQELFARDQAKLRTFQEQRRYELALRREDRIAQHARRQEITAAFLALGKAIASSGGSVSGGGSGGGGGDQDASAFKITPRGGGSERRAPQPVDASRFQRGGR